MAEPPSGIFLLFSLVGGQRAPKQQRDAPDSRKTHQRIDHPADRCRLTSENVGHEVKAEKSHAAPVQSAYNGQDQGDAIHYHALSLLFVWIRPYLARFLSALCKPCTAKSSTDPLQEPMEKENIAEAENSEEEKRSL